MTLYDLLDKHELQFNYEFPDWIDKKFLCDIKRQLDNDKQFRYQVLYKLISEHKDESETGDLSKFLDSWVYGYDTQN